MKLRATATLVGVAALMSAAQGCTRPATQLLVTVDTDLPPSRYGCIGVLVARYDGTGPDPSATRRFFAAPGELSVPFSFGVTPPDGDPRARVEVAAEALPSCDDPPAGARLVRRAIRTGFVPQARLPITLFLPAECDGCTVDETCGEIGAGCAPIPVYEPGELLAADASVTRPDAGTPDASSLDAFSADAFVEPPRPPRPLAPLSTSTVTSRRPTLRWALATGSDGARVVLCRDRACADVLETVDALGDHAQPVADLPVGAVFWRLLGRVGDVTGTDESPTWELFVGARSAGDTSWGSVYDWDGDGRADLATGAPYFSEGGRVYVHRSDGTGLETSFVTLTSAAADDGFGLALASGDVDGDGFPELVVGAPNADGALGRIHVFAREGASVGTAPVTSVVGTLAQMRMGSALAIGDADGDGYADVAVGTARTIGAMEPGRVYLFRGSAVGLEETPTAVLLGPDGGTDEFGGALAFGDFDGDGRADLAVGAWATRKIHLFHGTDAGLETTPWVSIDSTMVQFGIDVANAGDVNGDGFGDLVVGSSQLNNGRAFLLTGSSSGLSPTAITVLGSAARPYYYGASVAACDFDGDGFTDIVVASSNESQVDLFRGGAAGISTTRTTRLTGPDGAMSQFGTALVGLGDLDGDGDCELAVGAPFVMSYAGRDYVYRGDATSGIEAMHEDLTGPDLGIGRMGYTITSSL